jgi:hypothetical protein
MTRIDKRMNVESREKGDYLEQDFRVNREEREERKEGGSSVRREREKERKKRDEGI